jgi:hypothetical protein
MKVYLRTFLISEIVCVALQLLCFICEYLFPLLWNLRSIQVSDKCEGSSNCFARNKFKEKHKIKRRENVLLFNKVNHVGSLIPLNITKRNISCSKHNSKPSETPPTNGQLKNIACTNRDCPAKQTEQAGLTFYPRYKDHIRTIRNNNSNSEYSN